MSVNLITYTGKTRTALHDAIVYDVGVGQSGILYGCEVTASGNVLTIGNGYGIIKGRVFEIQQEDFNVRLQDGAGVLYGHLILTLDLSNAENPLSMSVTQDIYEYPDLTKDVNANYDTGIYQMEIAMFAASSTEITDIVPRTETVHGGVKVITDTDWYLGDIMDDGWYYFDHNHTPNDAPGTLVNGWLRVLSGGDSRKQILWRQGSETTQADTFVRTFTNGAWTTFRRLVCENEMYYMPGDQITLYGYGGGYMTGGKTMITFMVPTSKPFHSSVKGATYVETNDTVTIRQNNGYICDSVPLKNLTKGFTIRPNGLQINLSKSSGFGGTNNDGLGIAIRIVVKLT